MEDQYGKKGLLRPAVKCPDLDLDLDLEQIFLAESGLGASLTYIEPKLSNKTNQQLRLGCQLDIKLCLSFNR